MKPVGILRCGYCFGTTYEFRPVTEDERLNSNSTVSLRMTDKKCKHCTGGFIKLDT